MKISPFFAAGSVAAARPHASRACSAAALGDVLPSNARIESAVAVTQGGQYGDGNAVYPINPTNLPSLCAVTVNVSTSAVSNYRFGLFMPDKWNSRFLTVGNGAYAGGINWLDMGAGVRYGHAVVSTDTGHNGSNFGDTSWAVNNDERKLDYGWRSIHGTVELGKALTAAYYDKNITYSYYTGASAGGRQGLKEAMISPSSFDGIMIGAPAWETSHMLTWMLKVGTYNLPATDPKHLTAAHISLIAYEAVNQCDEVDGLKDGIISHPDRCKFNVSRLLCTNPGASPYYCLTAAQAETARKVYADYFAEGRFVYPGLTVSSEPQWPLLVTNTEPNALGVNYVRDILYDDPAWRWQTYNDSIAWQADTQDPGDFDATNYTALAALRDRGAKILLWHGYSDGLIPQRTSDVLYTRVAEALGGVDAIRKWFRYFSVPGLMHVVGTPVNAPWYFAAGSQHNALGTAVYSTPGFEDERHDALLALMRWVEKGKAIDEIVATTWRVAANPASGVLRQRPLCAWPERQVYKGGNADVPESFRCEVVKE